MSLSSATDVDEHESLKEGKDASSSKNTLAASPVYEGSEKADLELQTHAESQQVTQGDETISYPGGLKLFLLASVTLFILAMEPHIRMIRLLTAS
jgi:hypothetical protein